MSNRTDCVDLLRDFIHQGVSKNLRPAQDAILKLAMISSSPQSRVDAMDELLADLAASRASDAVTETQEAFDVVLVAMIEQTKMVVGPVSLATG